jgi:hypothetical protein
VSGRETTRKVSHGEGVVMMGPAEFWEQGTQAQNSMVVRSSTLSDAEIVPSHEGHWKSEHSAQRAQASLILGIQIFLLAMYIGCQVGLGVPYPVLPNHVVSIASYSHKEVKCWVVSESMDNNRLMLLVPHFSCYQCRT